MTSTTAVAPSPVQRQKQTRKTLVGTGIGNALEWYDWQTYATFAPFFATQLFNSDDKVSAMLSALAIFAVGFVARPFGGLLFGWIADRRGRKFALTLAVGIASFGSLLIAVTPTFNSVGVLASAMLLGARLIQGLAHGGEMPSAQTYLTESAPKEKRGLWSSLIYFSGMLGILFATLLGAVLNMALSEEAMLAWGWRVPFFLGAILGVYALVMRARLHETEAFNKVELAVRRESIWPQVLKNKKQALQVIGLTVGFTVSFYVWGVTAPGYASTAFGMDRGQALWASVVGNVVFLIALPLWGMLSDRIGRRPVLMIGTFGAAVMFFPMMALLREQPWQLAASMSVMLLFLAACASIVPALYAELFPTRIRTVGTAIPYALCVAIFGGTAPYLQAWLSSIGVSVLFSVYAVLLLLVSTAVIAFTLKETKGKDLTEV
ncbi:MFS transporter [Leifsonia sp. YAF41]|uniref:MFS transporter n=1 Tax=Leifsonia sp. YAF41 TaxID=3233086 RepID=UPI003F982FDF